MTRFTVSSEKIGRGFGVKLAALLSAIFFPPTGIPAAYFLWSAIRLRGTDPLEARRKLDAFRSWALYSLGYATAWLAGAALLMIFVVNDYVVARQFFNTQVLWETMPSIISGFQLTITLFVIAEIIILAWSLLIAIIRVLPGPAAAPLRWLAAAYVDIFRGLPSLLVILIVVFGIRQTRLPIVSSMSEFQLVLLALVITYGAYVSEILRAGINSINRSQSMAARSLGLSFVQTMRYVILPQAVRNMVPPLLNSFIALQKDTALVSIVGLLDAVNWARIESMNAASLTPFTTVSLGFLLITVPLTRFTDYYTKRVADHRAGLS